MQQLEEYITVGTKRMRCGYTTGTCAAAASRAAAELLCRGVLVPAVTIETPAGIEVVVEIEEHDTGDGWASCAVRKDSGDDPDVTNGALVYARVERCDEPGIHIDGGVGVGRVTREGLDQPVGNAAINSTPRRMIAEQVKAVLEQVGSPLPNEPKPVPASATSRAARMANRAGVDVAGVPRSSDEQLARVEADVATGSGASEGGETPSVCGASKGDGCAPASGAAEGDGAVAVPVSSASAQGTSGNAASVSALDPAPAGLLVTISIPAGVELAAKTFNPRLGIEGGISVLGTSGIVRPMSEDALISSIELELRTLRARGVEDVLVVPGNYGRDFACGQLNLALDDAVQCSNYFGATLDALCVLGFSRVLIVGHIGKMAKVAGGIMNTHSRVADCRVEVLAAHAALVGAPREMIAQVMAAATTDAALDVLAGQNLVAPTMDSLMASLADKLAHRVAGPLQVEAIVFSNVHGVLGKTPGADALAALWR